MYKLVLYTKSGDITCYMLHYKYSSSYIALSWNSTIKCFDINLFWICPHSLNFLLIPSVCKEYLNINVSIKSLYYIKNKLCWSIGIPVCTTALAITYDRRDTRSTHVGHICIAIVCHYLSGHLSKTSL